MLAEPEPIKDLPESEKELEPSELETSISVENTAVLTDVPHDIAQRFLVASPTVGLVTSIWKSSLSTTLPLVVPADTAARILARENCSTPVFWVH